MRLKTERKALCERDVAVLAGFPIMDVSEKVPANARPQQTLPPAWQVRDLPRPSLNELDVEGVLARHGDLTDFYSDVVAREMKKIGVAPTSHEYVTASDAATMSAVTMLMQISRMFDKRLADIESSATGARWLSLRSSATSRAWKPRCKWSVKWRPSGKNLTLSTGAEWRKMTPWRKFVRHRLNSRP